ncbi:MAG: phage tail length tape measure family protein [Bacteroidales bacterium]|nr:phage tail length tape measure family protein [Bacteroidales bacterium]
MKSDDFRKGMDQSEQRVSKFGQATQKMSMMAKAAWLAVGAAVIKFGKESVKAYNEQMAANAKLQNAIKNTNGALGLSYRELEKYASQIQSSFNVADDAAMNAMATMTTFGSVTGKMFKDAMQAAVDMAAFMGSDLTAEVKRLGLALEVPEIGVTQLRRAGIAFTNEQIAGIKKLLVEGKKYEAQMIILEGVQKKFGGAAKAAAETAQGAWKGAKMAVGDFMETVGRGIEGTKGVAVVIKDLFAGWSEARSAGGRKLFNATQEIDEYKRYIDATVGSGEFERRAAQVQEFYKKSLAEGTKIIDLNGNVIKEKYAKVYFAALEKYLKELTDTGEEAAGVMGGVAEEIIKTNVATEESYNGLIGKIDETISALEEKKKAATSISEIAAINDEMAALSKLKESYEAVSAVMLEMGRTPLPSVSGGNITGGVTATTQPKGVDIDALTKKYGKQKEEVQEIERSFMRITDAVYRITTSGLELGVMFGLDPEIARFLDQMVNSILDMKDALSGVSDSASDVAGKMGGIVGGVLSIGVAVAQIIKSAWLKDIQEVLDKSESRLNDIERTMERISDMDGPGDSWFTSDAFNNVQRLIDSLNAGIMGVFDESARLWAGLINTIDKTSKDATEGLTVWQRIWQGILTSGLSEVAHALENMLRDMSNDAASDALRQYTAAFEGIADIFGEAFDITKIDEYKQILQDLEDMDLDADDLYGGQMDDIRKGIENVIEYAEKLRETITAMVGDISGTLYNTVTVEWKKIWQENKEAGADSFAGIAEAAKKNIAQIMESIVTQQIWASVMAPVFDLFGTNLTNAIAGGGDITGVFDDFFKGFDAQLEGYYGLLDKFYTGAEGKGWDFTEPEVSSGATSEEDALDKLVEKQKLLNDLHKQWIELYGQETADAMLAGMGADADSYVKALEESIAELDALREAGTITDEQLRQLQDFQDQLLGIRDAAKEAAAQAEAEAKAASQAAYDAWSANMQAGLDGAANEYERLLAYEAAIKAAVEDTSMSEADRAEAIEAATKAQAELYKQVREGLESTYATEDDKWAAQQEQYRKDIEWATENGLPALAQKIQDTWDDEVIKRSTDALDEWKGTVDEALSGVESGRVAEIMKMQEDEAAQALASGGMVSMKKMLYFAGLLEAEQKSLNAKYETEEEKHLDTLAEFDSDYNDAKLLGDQELMEKIFAQREEYNNKYIQQQKDTASAEAQALLEGSEEYKALTGDLAKLGVDEARKALDAYRKMVEGSEDLSEEAKAEILAGLDEIQEKIDDIELDNLQQQFEDIQSVISSISSILGSFGASSELTEGLSGLSTVIGGLFTVLSGGSWVTKFSGIAAMIGGIVTVAKSLKGLFSDGNEDLTTGVTKLSTAYQKLVGIMNKAFGDNKAALQNRAIENIKAQIAEYQRLIQKEASKTGFWYWLIGDLKDDSLIMQYQQAIENLNKELGRYDEEIKSDFLQTDTDSFVNELRDIWAQSYDSAEDYYKALENLNNKTIDNMIARWIEKKLVEDQVNSALNRLYESGMTDSAFDLFAAEIEQISNNAKKEYEKWQDAGYFQGEEGGSSMDGSIARTATEAQFNQYLGYVQNLNITAHDILNALSDQPALIDFSALAQISRGIANDVERIKDNTEYCRMLESMKNDLAAIRRGSSVAYN